MRTEKQCCACRKTLPIDQFHGSIRQQKLANGTTRGRTIHEARCHSCRRMYFQCRRYGLTDEQYRMLMKEAKCHICGSTGDWAKHGLHIDHCHRTNRIRGVLCLRCNAVVGQLDKAFNGNLDRLRAYLQNNLNMIPAAPVRSTFDVRVFKSRKPSLQPLELDRRKNPRPGDVFRCFPYTRLITKTDKSPHRIYYERTDLRTGKKSQSSCLYKPWMNWAEFAELISAKAD